MGSSGTLLRLLAAFAAAGALAFAVAITRPTPPTGPAAPRRSAGALIFIGDSITAAGPWLAAFPGRQVVNAGVPGDTSGDVEARLASIQRPAGATAVLMLGINDILRGSQAAPVAARLLRIRQTLMAGGTRVVVVSTLPCEAARFGPACLAPVRELNQLLRRSVPAADFLDLEPLISDSSGLRRSLAPDGLHPGPAVYQLWLERLMPML